VCAVTGMCGGELRVFLVCCGGLLTLRQVLPAASIGNQGYTADVDVGVGDDCATMRLTSQ
jgi:hypothetical protein